VYSVEFLPSAARQLAKLDRSVQRRIARVINRLALDPRGRGIVKLQGAEDVWRIRVGDYRMLYQIADDRLVILVVAIGHRATVYRR
jgi:mRNA interferase RelE/StbE